MKIFSIFYYYGLLRKTILGSFILWLFAYMMAGLIMGSTIGLTIALFAYLAGNGIGVFIFPAVFSGIMGFAGLIAGLATYDWD